MSLLSPKDPAEIITLAFDFSAVAAAVLAPMVSAAHESGPADPSPAAILSGAAQVQGATVLQKIVGGVAGATYRLRCQVDTPDGERFVLPARLSVRGV